MDIWDRAVGGGGGDIGAGSMYQSVLTDLEWGDVSDSPFLQALQGAATDGLLSIKFNVDGYNMDRTSPEFTRGRVVGSIGPATADEPRHFVAGRQFIPQNTGQGNFYAAAAGIGFCVARFDEAGSQVLLDLGNALPTTTPGGPLVNQGSLQLMVGPQAWSTPVSQAQASSAQPVGKPIEYLAPGWYERTAGVVVVPVAPEQHALLLSNPLALVLTQPGQLGQYTAESPGGLFVRADQFVFRADAGTSVDVALVATRYGQPYAGATVLLTQDASQLQPGPTPGSPLPGTPTSALTFPEQLTTDAQGRVTLHIEAGDPQNSRGYIDGQVYGVRPSLADIGFPTGDYPLGQWNFISLLLWDYFRPAEPVAWYGDLQPIFQQYANLYPIMKRFLDLANPLDVWTNRELLTMAFGLPLTDPNTMPVTRDLSTPKRQAILAWLGQPEMHLGAPSLATPASTELVAAGAAAGGKPQAAAPAVAALGAAEAQRGGKAAAAARRMVLRQELL